MMKKSACRGSAGFTLLELIVAFTLFALIAGIVFSSLAVALNSYQESQKRIDVESRRRALTDHMKRQVGSLFPLRPRSFLTNPGVGQDLGSELEELVESDSPLFQGTAESMTFVSVAPLVLHKNPGLTVVRYGLANDEYGDFYLGAMETQFTGIYSFETMASVPRGTPYPLVKDIQTLRFEYYGYDAATESYGWFDYWDGEEMQSVPGNVRITYNDDYLIIPINADFSIGRIRSGLQNLIRR